MSFYLCSAGLASIFFISYLFLTLLSLSYFIAGAGAPACLVKATKLFMNRIDFVEIAGEILTTIVHSTWRQDVVASERRILIEAGVSPLCMEMLSKYYNNAKITSYCFVVIHHLTESSNSEIKMELTEASACEIIVEALKENCLVSPTRDSNILVAYHGFMAIDALIDYYNNDATVIRFIADRFVSAGLCEVMIPILEKYLKDAVIQYDWNPEYDDDDEDCVLDYGQGVIRHLSHHNEAHRARLTKLGAGNWLPELF